MRLLERQISAEKRGTSCHRVAEVTLRAAPTPAIPCGRLRAVTAADLLVSCVTSRFGIGFCSDFPSMLVQSDLRCDSVNPTPRHHSPNAPTGPRRLAGHGQAAA